MNRVAIGLHAGAGAISKEDINQELSAQIHEKLESAIMFGKDALVSGSSAVEAVESVIAALEDDEFFNAGKGSTLTREKSVEMDASIIDGATGKFGAIASVNRVKNPIKVASSLLKEENFSFLVSKGAVDYAIANQFDFEDEEYFKTEMRILEIAHIEKAISLSKTWNSNSLLLKKNLSTVGAVAIDLEGNMAAGTSTGGVAYKKPGRVGDSPIIGSGSYAENGNCALSLTGDGEKILQLNLAKEISCRIKYCEESLSASLNHAIFKLLAEIDGLGGVIGIDKRGNFECAFNTDAMFRAHWNPENGTSVELF